MTDDLDPFTRHGITIAPTWNALATEIRQPDGRTTVDHLDLITPGIAPSPYPSHHRQPDAIFPGGLSNQLVGDGTNPDTIAANLIAMLAVAGLHEGIEWIRVGGQRLATPHPYGAHEDEMWTWLQTEMLGVLARYRHRYPADPGGHDHTNSA